jgi:hypothetical protein
VFVPTKTSHIHVVITTNATVKANQNIEEKYDCRVSSRNNFGMHAKTIKLADLRVSL